MAILFKRKTIQKLLLVLFGLAIANTSTAQEQGSKTEQDTTITSWDLGFDGSYQVIIGHKDLLILEIDDQILQEINSRRHDSQVVFWEYSAYYTIKIIPNILLQSDAFEPLEQYVYVH